MSDEHQIVISYLRCTNDNCKDVNRASNLGNIALNALPVHICSQDWLKSLLIINPSIQSGILCNVHFARHNIHNCGLVMWCPALLYSTEGWILVNWLKIFFFYTFFLCRNDKNLALLSLAQREHIYQICCFDNLWNAFLFHIYIWEYIQPDCG